MSNTKDFKVKNGIQPTVYHEAVGTVVSGSVGYNLAGASYDSVNFSVASQDTSPLDMLFNDDGTKMYMMGTQNDSIYQYTLSTAYDLSTASYDSVSFSVASQAGDPREIALNNDGTKLYLLDGLPDRYIYQYTLSTAFDLSTTSYDSVSFQVAGQADNPSSITFNSDGTRMYISCYTNDSIYQYSLSTAFDLSTASYDSVSLDVSSQDTTPFGLSFNNSGTIMYLVGRTNDTIYEYALSTAFDLSTALYSNVSFYVGGEDAVPSSITFNSSGTKMYVVGFIDDSVHQYSTVLTTAELDLSTGSVFEVTPTSDIQVTLSNPADSGTVSGATLLLEGGSSAGYDLANAEYSDVSFSVASQDTNPFGMAFSNDGTKMYVVGQSTDTIYQYSLSTAFDLNTASYSSVNLNVNSQDPEPSGMAFNSDGTKMYVVGDTNNSLFQYSLSTGFDLSTASYDSVSFSVSGQDITPLDVAFNNDGTKMYVLGNTNDTVFQYSLSTAFDLSTASYDSVSFSVGSQESTPLGITFKSDGTKMYVVGRGVDTVFQYSLSTAFDLSTTSYDSVSFSVGGQDTIPYGVVFSGDGTKMYVIGITTDAIYQYSTATPATITYDTAIEWPSGTAPTAPAIGETDIITFNTTDGGTTYKSVVAIDGAS